jgi:hypothetical protein
MPTPVEEEWWRCDGGGYAERKKKESGRVHA